MRWGLYILLSLLFAATLPVSADPLVTLEPDFFDSDTPYAGPNIRTLDPDFFKPKRGQLDRANPNEFGCKSVWGVNPRAEAGAVARIIQDYCLGKYTVQWIPSPPKWKLDTQSDGYTRICCVRKARYAPYRKPGPR